MLVVRFREISGDIKFSIIFFKVIVNVNGLIYFFNKVMVRCGVMGVNFNVFNLCMDLFCLFYFNVDFYVDCCMFLSFFCYYNLRLSMMIVILIFMLDYFELLGFLCFFMNFKIVFFFIKVIIEILIEIGLILWMNFGSRVIFLKLFLFLFCI